MKVLIVSDYDAADGGAEVVTHQLRDGLRARGHETRWFTSSGRAKGAARLADAECFGTTGPFRTVVQSANPAAYVCLQREIKNFKPDVVHVGLFLTQLSPLILPLLRDVPSVYYAHWLRTICPTGSKLLPNDTECAHRAGIACLRHRCLSVSAWPALMMQRQMLRRWQHVFSRVVANSWATRVALEADGFPVTDVIPCGVASGQQTTALAHAPTAIYAGRLVRQKGLHVLLDAWVSVVREIPEARLIIVGDGPERAALERNAPSRVVFLGRLAHDDLQRVAREAWVQVVPSIGFESFGLVAVEAMMRGQAVLASRVGGLPELFDAASEGMLVEPGHSQALARSLCTLLRDRKLCEHIGMNALRRANTRFTIDLHTNRFVALYEALRGTSQTNRHVAP